METTPVISTTPAGPTEMATSSLPVPEKETIFAGDASIGVPALDASFWGNDFTLSILCY